MLQANLATMQILHRGEVTQEQKQMESQIVIS
jgi:hypothetical protein